MGQREGRKEGRRERRKEGRDGEEKKGGRNKSASLTCMSCRSNCSWSVC
jgi:hypothetical protein